MKFEQVKLKKCVCGRNENHEHKTMQIYVLIEKSDDHRSELFMHGYDNEDDHIYDFIKECRLENPSYTYKLQIQSEKSI